MARQQLSLLPEDVSSPDDGAANRAAVDQLGDAVKAAIRAARMEGWSYRRLAEEYGITPETARAVCRAAAR